MGKLNVGDSQSYGNPGDTIAVSVDGQSVSAIAATPINTSKVLVATTDTGTPYVFTNLSTLISSDRRIARSNPRKKKAIVSNYPFKVLAKGDAISVQGFDDDTAVTNSGILIGFNNTGDGYTAIVKNGNNYLFDVDGTQGIHDLVNSQFTNSSIPTFYWYGGGQLLTTPQQSNYPSELVLTVDPSNYESLGWSQPTGVITVDGNTVGFFNYERVYLVAESKYRPYFRRQFGFNSLSQGLLFFDFAPSPNLVPPAGTTTVTIHQVSNGGTLNIVHEQVFNFTSKYTFNQTRNSTYDYTRNVNLSNYIYFLDENGLTDVIYPVTKIDSASKTETEYNSQTLTDGWIDFVVTHEMTSTSSTTYEYSGLFNLLGAVNVDYAEQYLESIDQNNAFELWDSAELVESGDGVHPSYVFNQSTIITESKTTTDIATIPSIVVRFDNVCIATNRNLNRVFTTNHSQSLVHEATLITTSEDITTREITGVNVNIGTYTNWVKIITGNTAFDLNNDYNGFFVLFYDIPGTITSSIQLDSPYIQIGIDESLWRHSKLFTQSSMTTTGEFQNDDGFGNEFYQVLEEVNNTSSSTTYNLFESVQSAEVECYITKNKTTTLYQGVVEFVDESYTSDCYLAEYQVHSVNTVNVNIDIDSSKSIDFYCWANESDGVIVVPVGDHTISLLKYIEGNKKQVNLYTVGDTFRVAISKKLTPDNLDGEDEWFADIYEFNTTAKRFERIGNESGSLSEITGTEYDFVSYYPV